MSTAQNIAPLKRQETHLRPVVEHMPQEQFLMDIAQTIYDVSSAYPMRYRVLKRLLDISISSVCIVAFIPVFVAIALVIKLTSKGPVLFTQTRIGKNMRPFKIFKFRTMYQDVTESLNYIRDQETGKLRRPTYKEDDRVTVVGRFLRTWSLDELPQLFNILIGDMSLVGPRPLTIRESFSFPAEAIKRFAIPAGLTGMGQISERHQSLTPERFKKDMEYVETASLWTDFRIMFLTCFYIRSRF